MPCNQFPSTQRRKAWGRITILFALIALALTALPTASFAGTDTAGNVLATDNDANSSGVEGDLYWAGQALNLNDASIDRDIIAAGDTLSIRDCTVGGAVRLAARTIDIAKTTVDGSVTVVGQHVVLNSDSTANCFYAIGETVALRGSTNSAALAGDTVTIDGTIEGDVEVWADKLILGKDAHITGTVKLVFPRATASAAGMLHQRPMPLWVSGLLSTIAIVPAVLLLIISIAGLSLAGALLCGVIGIALVSSAFAGCAIARMVGNSQNRYAMAAVGGVIAGALTGLPLVGDFINGVAFVFTLGYIIQIIWRNAHLKPQQPANTPGLPTA